MKWQNLVLSLFGFLALMPYCVFGQETSSTETAEKNNSPCQPCAENYDKGWCWGSDPGTAREKNALYTDALKVKDYEIAVEPLEWVLANTPNLNKAIYINGIKIYNKLVKKAKKEKDTENLQKYRQRELDLYDIRIACYGAEANVLQRKGAIAYSYLKKDTTQKKALFNLYSRILALNGNKTKTYNLTYLMITNINAKVNKFITEEQALAVYDKITEVLDYNIANTTDDKQQKWIQAQSKIDGFLPKITNITCEHVEKRMLEDIRNKKQDMKLQKRALKYLITAKCFDNPLFLEVGENIFVFEPALGLAKTISSQYIKLENYDKAIEWKQKAIDLIEKDSSVTEKDPLIRANLHLDIAALLAKQGKKKEARTKAYKAIEVDASEADKAYTLVGNLYMISGSECEDSNPVKSRTIYLAAYDMFQKAGDKESMARAKEQFPSIEDIFTQNLNEGDPIDVICWIGGKTIIRKR